MTPAPHQRLSFGSEKAADHLTGRFIKGAFHCLSFTPHAPAGSMFLNVVFLASRRLLLHCWLMFVADASQHKLTQVSITSFDSSPVTGSGRKSMQIHKEKSSNTMLCVKSASH